MFNEEAYRAMESTSAWTLYYSRELACGHEIVVQGVRLASDSQRVAWRVSKDAVGDYLTVDFADNQEIALRTAEKYIDEHFEYGCCGTGHCTVELWRDITRETADIVTNLDDLVQQQIHGL